jgi:hypothetical protein
VSSINEKYLSTNAVNNAIDLRKNSLIFFFDDDRVDLHFKAVSALEWLQDDFVFYSVAKPTEATLKEYYITKLPAVRGAMVPQVKDGEEPDQENVPQFQYGGKLDFDDIMFNLLKLTGKQAQYQKRQKELAEQRRTGKVKEERKLRKGKKKAKKSGNATKEEL